MNYESFEPENITVKKNGNTFLQRIITKLNNQVIEKLEVKHEGNETKFQKDTKSNQSNVESLSGAELKVTFPVVKRHSEGLIHNEMKISKIIKSVKTNLTTTIRESSENLAIKRKVDRGYWMPDSICHKCYNCEEEFTTIKRKHHCRMCGQVFCYYCCSFELPGQLWKFSKPQRSCQSCFLSYHMNSSSKRHSNRKSSRSQYKSSMNEFNIRPSNNGRGSIASDKCSITEMNLSSSKKNLSFSSNDIQLYSEHNSDLVLKFDNAASDSEITDDFQEFKELKKSNVSEIEELSFNQDFKIDRRSSFMKTNNKYFFPSHILTKEKIFGIKNIVSHNSTNSLNPSEITSNQVQHKQALLSIWRLIIMETESNRRRGFTIARQQNQTRNLEKELSFTETTDEEFKNVLPIIFTGVNPSKSCCYGNVLIDWISNNAEIMDRNRAFAICQSYLEMELLYPYFDQEENKIFKDDNTLYVIREFLAEFSPKPNSNNLFFGDSEMLGHTGNYSSEHHFGNSTFYMDKGNTDSKSDLTDENSTLIKSPSMVHPDFTSDNFELILENSVSKKSNTNIWNKSCKYLEKLLKQELHDYNLDITWCNIILPICKLVSEKISPTINEGKLINDIRNFIQIKKIPNTSKSDCRINYSIAMSKNVDFPMRKEIRNPNVILIRSSIDYGRHKKLVSMDSLLLQEDEYLKNCVIKLKSLGPDIVVVEGSVSLLAKDMMEKCGLILISNVRKEQIERLSKMLDATIFDSVDSLGANVESQLGKCSQFCIQKYTLMNGKSKHILFFKLFNPKHGCTLLLHGKSLSELVRVKYVIKYIIIAFKNAYFELAFFMNFQIRSFPSSNSTTNTQTCRTDDKSSHPNHVQNDSPSSFLDLIENRCIAMSVNVHYNPPEAVIRSIYYPDVQNRLLATEIINLSWKEKLNNVLRRKLRHISAELYDFVRMNNNKHPQMCNPELHAFTNTFHNNVLDSKEQCMLYQDFRVNGSRFHPVNQVDQEASYISTVDFEGSDLACKLGFLTKSQEIKWRNIEKRNFESISDSFNPRNYQRILLLYSIQTRIGICEKPRKISLNFYENADRTLGNFVSSMLNDVATCPAKCDSSIFEHVYKFISNSGCIEVSLHPLEADSHSKLFKSVSLDSDESKLKLWNWCSRCDKLLPLQQMTDETWHLSLGRFFDILFNLNLTDSALSPAQCYHSIQTDIHYYFTQKFVNKALEIKYFPITVFEFQTPDLFIQFSPNYRLLENMLEDFRELQTEVGNVTAIKTKYNLEIKEKLCKLKSISKEKDSELWDFLKRDSNSEQYSQRVEDIHNLMEMINSPSTGEFDLNLFNKHENFIKDEIIYIWIDVVNLAAKWDIKLYDAFEKDDKIDKRNNKSDSRNAKASNDNLFVDPEIMKKIDKNISTMEIKEKPVFSTGYMIPCDVDHKISVPCENYEIGNNIKIEVPNIEISPLIYSISRTSTENSFENADEAEFNNSKRERSNTLKETELRTLNMPERQSGTNSNTMQPFRKLFNNLFTSNGYKILEDPTPTNLSYCFTKIECVKVPVVVNDDSITSSVAFALSSDLYCELLSEFQLLSNLRESERFEIIPRIFTSKSTRLSSDPPKVDAINLPNCGPILNNEKSQSTFLDPNKDKDLSVKYFHRAEIDDLSDIIFQDSPVMESKSDVEDIKIEVSTEEIMTEDIGHKPFSAIKPTGKSTPNNDFIISLANHKVKCVCKIYYARQFHELRQLIFKNDELSYIRSLSKCKSWITTGGKSGLKFRKTLDDRFIIKQLHLIELDGFRKFHEKYFTYVSEAVLTNQKCVLAKILGIYSVDYCNSLTKVNEKMDFLVMENVFYDQKPSRIFDLKGNKQGAANISMDKISISENSVMQDKEFINYNRANPIYVSWQAQIALKETLTRDTDFLQSLPVMDYSLLVGVDETNQILIIGIIDYLRMFTMNKLIEMHFKQKLLTPHGELPTVIQPQKYQKRFLEAMEEYFLVCPIPWDHLLVSNSSSSSNINRKPNFAFTFSAIYPRKPTKRTRSKNGFDRSSETNTLRSGSLGCFGY